MWRAMMGASLMAARRTAVAAAETSCRVSAYSPLQQLRSTSYASRRGCQSYPTLTERPPRTAPTGLADRQ
eukprot:4587761-Pleurochrysis_carterae.AAC.1